MIFSAVFYRSSWRYEERAYRRILLDTGHALGNLECYAPHEYLLVYPISGFCDAALNSVLFLDPQDEGVLMVCALTRKEDMKGVAVRRSSVYPSGIVATPLRTPREGLLQRLHDASSIPGTEVFTEGKVPDDGRARGAPRGQARDAARGHAVRASGPRDDPRPPVHARVLGRRAHEAAARRRSSRTPTRSRFREGSARRRGDAARLRSLADRDLRHRAGVEGIEAGIYYYAPRSRELRCVRKGQFRDQSHHFCLGQELGLSAAAVVVHVSDLRRALDKYGERAYRYLHLDAGHLGQRMNLSALALGAGASGIGGFFDDEVNALLGVDRDRIIVYITCLGRPASG